MRWRLATGLWLMGCVGCAGLAPQDRRDESMLPSRAVVPTANLSLESGRLPPAQPILPSRQSAANGQAPPTPETADEPELKRPKAEHAEADHEEEVPSPDHPRTGPVP